METNPGGSTTSRAHRPRRYPGVPLSDDSARDAGEGSVIPEFLAREVARRGDAALVRDTSRGYTRRVVAEILQEHRPHRVNWSAVADMIGVSRQAVHQVKWKILRSGYVRNHGLIRPDAIPLHRAKGARVPGDEGGA